MKLGARGERIACKFLKRAGYRILARNYVCPAGELDIIALDDDTLVFVEVKTRSSAHAADPEANVTARKRRQLTRTARYYVTAHAVQECPARFDIVAVVLGSRRKPEVEHFADAFAAVYG